MINARFCEKTRFSLILIIYKLSVLIIYNLKYSFNQIYILIVFEGLANVTLKFIQNKPF